MFPGLLFVLALSARASAQSIADAKQPFVASLIQVLENLSGTFGDERARVASGVDGMDAGLRNWDAVLKAYSAAADSPRVVVAALELDRGRTAQAIEMLASAASADPKNLNVHRLLGLAYESQGDRAKAASEFLQAFLLNPQDPEIGYLYWFHRAPTDDPASAAKAAEIVASSARELAARGAAVAAPFVGLAVVTASQTTDPVFLPARYADAARQLRMRRYDEATASFRAAWASDPLNADPAMTSASLANAAGQFREGKFGEAAEGFAAVTKAFPSSSQAQRLLGAAYWMNDEDAKAIPALQSAVAMDARDERARLLLAQVLVDSKQPADAEQMLRETVAMLPESGQAHWRLAGLLAALHRDVDARVERERAAALTVAQEGRALAMIAESYVAEGDLPKAAEVARTRVAADFNDAAAHEQRGRIERQDGNDVDALVEFSVATVLDANRPDTLSAVAQIQLGAGHYMEAIESARQALAKNPRSREARFALARALLQTGAEADGKNELAAAEQLQADELEATRRSFATNLVRIQAAQREQDGNWDEAAKLRRDVASQPSAAPSDFALLGEALAHAGRHDEAVDILREAIRRDPDPDVYRSLIRELTAAGRTREADTVRAEYQRVKRERFLQ